MQYVPTVVLLLYILSTSAFGETRVLFSPEGSIRDCILENIGGCSSSLEIAVHDFTSGDIAEALVSAKNRGVKVRIVMDKKQAEKEGSLYGFLKDEGFDVLLLKGRVGGSMHNNFVIFDNKLVLTGSYNWTEYAEKFNYENVIITDEKAVVEMYQHAFERLRVGTEIVERKQEPVTQIQPPAPLKAAPQEEIKTEELKADTRKQDSKSWFDFLSTYPKKSPPPPEANTAGKEFLDISFEELDKIFGNESTLSRAEKNEKWEQYKGKYLRWTGEVVYRGIGRTDWNRMGIKHTDKLDVELWFDYRMMNTVLSINKGDIITYTGMLSIRRGYNSPYRIKNAWIEEFSHPQAGQQGAEGHMGGKE